VRPGATAPRRKVENIVYFGTDTHFTSISIPRRRHGQGAETGAGIRTAEAWAMAVGLRIAPEAMQVLKD